MKTSNLPELPNSQLSNPQLPNPQLSDAQISLLKQQDDHQYTFALEALKTQERDRAAEREYRRDLYRIRSKTWIWRTAIIAVFALGALILNKEQFMLEALKYSALVFGGGGIGYFYGRRKAQKNPQQ